MVWDPQRGRIPRGFCGATGTLDDVRLVLVCAEPGDPHVNENHACNPTPEGYLNSAYSYAWGCFATGKDQFHRNIRSILDLCFPRMDFTEQMHYAFITDAVLCSAASEGGRVNSGIEDYCVKTYLAKLIDKMPNATIVALGCKAQNRLRRANITGFISAFAAAPPGCNSKGATKSWKQIAVAVQKAAARNA